MTLHVLAALPFVAAAAIGLMPATARRAIAWLAGLVALIALALTVSLTHEVLAGEVVRHAIDWIPGLGVDLGFRVDGLALTFLFLITGIGALVVLYAAYYLDPKDSAPRFFASLMAFMGAMVGVVMADNLILLVVFWELTSLTSFLLIGFWSDDQAARRGARMALTITGLGGLALLGGVLIVGHIVGSFDLAVVLASGAKIQAHPLFPVALVLVLTGAFTKSAQFPFHIWLPRAMAAPTPVSAYLHSATMVKAGVFLLGRLYPALGGNELWFYLVTFTGLTTLLVGAWFAMRAQDLKGLLAYSTISHLGLITMLFGLEASGPTPGHESEQLAIVAALFHIINHATFKASLFMAAGIIDHETGTRDMRRLSGLLRALPWTGPLAIVAAAAMAGVPLLNGFISKEMFFAETLALEGHQLARWLIPIGAVVAAILSVAYSARFIHGVFFGRVFVPSGEERAPHEPPTFMRIPTDLLVLLCVAVGIVPQLIIGPLLAVASEAALGSTPPAYSLSLWHGFNLPLAMSAMALVGGIIWYLVRRRRATGAAEPVGPVAGELYFLVALRALSSVARRITARLESGKLESYLTLLVALILTVALVPLLTPASGGEPVRYVDTPLEPMLAVAWTIGIVAAIGTVLSYHRRLTALVLLGAVGLVMSLTFVYLSAPDLALTQVIVEVVTIVLMMLALRWLPNEGPPEPLRLRFPPLKVALGALSGVAASALAYPLLRRAQTASGDIVSAHGLPSIAPFYLDKTLPEGGGANAVNVIIVDFRGLDTLGEIAVLGLAGVIIYGLLSHSRNSTRPALTEPQSLMLRMVTRLVVPTALLIAIYLFLRGHSQPGGGFVAGLVLAVAIFLLYVAHGRSWVNDRMSDDFRPWIGWGLLVACLTGIASWFFQAPFLTSSWFSPELPLVGAVPLASASLFDLGVFLTVVGATLVALIRIADYARETP